MTLAPDAGSTPTRPETAAGGYAITVAFDLVEGAAAEFLRLVGENAAMSVALEPDCLRFDVLTRLDGSSPEILLYEVYTDRAAFARHLASEHYLTFDRRTRDLVRRKAVASFEISANAKPSGPR